jgi:diacylglycerol kinase (ATP)
MSSAATRAADTAGFDPAGQRVLAVVSRNNWNRLVELEAHLRTIYPQLTCIAPASLEDMDAEVRASSGYIDLVVAVGGDGTLHRVLQSIDLESQALGLLPAGTGNDLARSLGYPEDLPGRVAHLQRLKPRAIDVGLVGGAVDAPIRYHNSAGFGLDASTLVKRESNEILRRNYKLAFGVALLGMRPLAARIEVGGRELAGSYWWVLAMNNCDIGRGTRIAPVAKIDDGVLDLLLVDGSVSKLGLVKLLPKAERGGHVGQPGITYVQGTEIRCVLEQPVGYVAVDGELYASDATEITFTVERQALKLLS